MGADDHGDAVPLLKTIERFRQRREARPHVDVLGSVHGDQEVRPRFQTEMRQNARSPDLAVVVLNDLEDRITSDADVLAWDTLPQYARATALRVGPQPGAAVVEDQSLDL